MLQNFDIANEGFDPGAPVKQTEKRLPEAHGVRLVAVSNPQPSGYDHTITRHLVFYGPVEQLNNSMLINQLVMEFLTTEGMVGWGIGERSRVAKLNESEEEYVKREMPEPDPEAIDPNAILPPIAVKRGVVMKMRVTIVRPSV